MKKFLLILVLILGCFNAQAKTVEEFYNMINKNQSMSATYLDGVYYGVLFENLKDTKLVQEKYDACQKNLTTIQMLLGYKILYSQGKLDKNSDANLTLYQLIHENCLDIK